MSSQNLAFGAVGGVTNCANPVYAAKLLSLEYENVLDDCQLIPPTILIGPGANKYCTEIFPPLKIVDNDKLCSELAKLQHSKALSYLQQYNYQKEIERLDTVGGISIFVIFL